MKTLKSMTGLMAVLILLCSCTTLYQGVITITKVVETAMEMWSDLSVNGKTSAEIDKRVTAAYNQYRAACGVAQNALRAYKLSGDPAQHQAAVDAAKEAAQRLLDLITPLLIPQKAVPLQQKLDRAKTI